MGTVDFSKFDNSWYQPGNKFKIGAWYFVNRLVFNTSLPFPSKLKTIILRLFGATVGSGFICKPKISIKYPWFLSVGSNVWIGENVWIDNLDLVTIGSNVCISQGAMLLCGNHDFSKSSFDLLVKPISISEGAWIGAKSVVCPGSIIGKNTVVTVGSIAINNLESDSIYKGNPAEKIKDRYITS